MNPVSETAYQYEPRVSKETESSKKNNKPSKAWQIDPLIHALQWIDDHMADMHPGASGLPFPLLRQMGSHPIPASIIGTRINQVLPFMRVRPSPYEVGFQIVPRNPAQPFTEIEQMRAEEIANTLLYPEHPEAMPLGMLMQAVLRDSLMFDQATFELLYNRRGEVVGAVPVDASSIRLIRPKKKIEEKGKFFDPNAADSEPRYAQIIRGQRVATFTKDELAFLIRRPRSWLGVRGYGFPELEVVLSTLAYIINAETFNASHFTNGIHSSTILAVYSAMSEEEYNAFKRAMTALLRGPNSAHRLPLVRLDPRSDVREEIKPVTLAPSNRDMQFAEWLNWLIAGFCAEFQMDPMEIGWMYRTGNKNTDGNISAEERIKFSKERGLRPLLWFWEEAIDRQIVRRIDPNFRFRLVGFGGLSAKEKISVDIQAGRAFKTLNEVRAEHGLEQLPDPFGSMILDPQFMQMFVHLQTLQAMLEGGLEGGEGGELPDEASIEGEAGVAPEGGMELGQNMPPEIAEGAGPSANMPEMAKARRKKFWFEV